MRKLDVSYQEKLNVVNILSALLIAFFYGLFVYNRHLSGIYDLATDCRAWGKVFLIFIAVSIVVRILIFIVFHILNAIATREHDIPISDERDKLIKLKARSNGYHTFTFSMMTSFIFLAVGKPFYWLLLVFIIAGLLGEIVDNGSQIYYQRKGL